MAFDPQSARETVKNPLRRTVSEQPSKHVRRSSSIVKWFSEIRHSLIAFWLYTDCEWGGVVPEPTSRKTTSRRRSEGGSHNQHSIPMWLTYEALTPKIWLRKLKHYHTLTIGVLFGDDTSIYGILKLLQGRLPETQFEHFLQVVQRKVERCEQEVCCPQLLEWLLTQDLWYLESAKHLWDQGWVHSYTLIPPPEATGHEGGDHHSIPRRNLRIYAQYLTCRLLKDRAVSQGSWSVLQRWDKLALSSTDPLSAEESTQITTETWSLRAVWNPDRDETVSLVLHHLRHPTTEPLSLTLAPGALLWYVESDWRLAHLTGTVWPLTWLVGTGLPTTTRFRQDMMDVLHDVICGLRASASVREYPWAQPQTWPDDAFPPVAQPWLGLHNGEVALFVPGTSWNFHTVDRRLIGRVSYASNTPNSELRELQVKRNSNPTMFHSFPPIPELPDLPEVEWTPTSSRNSSRRATSRPDLSRRHTLDPELIKAWAQAGHFEV